MPFESEAQRGWMWAKHPAMAKKWEKHTPNKKLPRHVKKPKVAPACTKTAELLTAAQHLYGG